jgi:hypothetical protein
MDARPGGGDRQDGEQLTHQACNYAKVERAQLRRRDETRAGLSSWLMLTTPVCIGTAASTARVP